MPLNTTDPELQSSKVTVQYICKQLGFEDGTPRSQSDLTTTTHDWRRSYISDDGKHSIGKDLRHRYTEEGDHDLLLMTQAYLDRGGNGSLHWPARPGNGLEYHKDQQRITELVQTLFWRQNTIEYRKAVKRAKEDAPKTPSKGGNVIHNGQTTPCQETRTWGHQFKSSPSSHKQSLLNFEKIQNPVRPMSGVTSPSSEEKLHSYIDVSEDDLPSWRGLVSRYSSTPKQPLRVAEGDQTLGKAKISETSATLAPQEGTVPLLQGITPVAAMAAYVEDCDTDTDQSQPPRSAIFTKSTSSHEPKKSKEDEYDSAYDVTPQNSSPTPQRQEAVGDTWGSGFDVQDPYTLRNSTRTKVSAFSEQNSNNDIDGGQSTMKVSAQQTDTPDTPDNTKDAVEGALLTSKRILSRRRNISGYHVPSFGDEPGDKDPTYIPTKRSRKKRTSSLSTSGSTVSLSSPTAHHIPVARKRARIPSACIQCRRKKVACNRKKPCARCTNRNECTYRTISISRPPPPFDSAREVAQSADQPISSLKQPIAPTSQRGYEVDDMVEGACSFLRQGRPADHEEHQLPSPRLSNSGVVEYSEPEAMPTKEPQPSPDTSTRPSGYHAPNHMGRSDFHENLPHSELGTANPLVARQDPTPTPLRPPYRMNYFILSNIPRPSRRKWVNGTILNKTLDALFEEISTFLCRNDVREINFVLDTSRAEFCLIPRNDDEGFEEMKVDFEKAIIRDRKVGISQFRIELEVNPGEKQPEKVEEQSDDEMALL